MTEQEAEVFATRLTRIWEPETSGFYVNLGQDKEAAEISDLSSDFEYNADLKAGALLEVVFGATWHDAYKYFELSCYGVSLICEDGHVYPWMAAGYQVREQAFANEWMDFFRPRCWLSGAPIESTAQEKAEWIRGFSREEIEAWNLEI